MSDTRKVIITGWNALLKCRVCGNELESRGYRSWSIDSTTINHCPICNTTTNHVVIGSIAEMMDYEEYKSRIQKSTTVVPS